MQFTFAINSEEVEAAIESFALSLESGEQARVVADDFRDLLAAPASTARTRGKTVILGPRELGATGKVKA